MSITNQELENFIVECQPKLEEIRASLNAFNIFNVLGVQHREIRHSNFLGWLFDPNESHQLGDIFLKDLFKLIRETGSISPEKLVSLLLEDLSETIVHRESENNIDILIINEELGILVCIENKIYANYSDHQLSKYYHYIEETYAQIDDRVYLTLTPSESHHHLKFKDGEKYQNISYLNIISLIKQNKKYINTALPTVKESINQYIDMTEKSITYTSKEVKLANEIYRKYKNEINFIINSKPDFKSFKDVLWKYIEEGNLEGIELSHTLPTSSIIRILPRNDDLKQLFRKPEFNSWGKEYMFCLEIFVEKDVVWLKWVFGNIHNKERELELQNLKSKWHNEMQGFSCFKNNNITIDMHNSRPTSGYPGICGITLFDDDEYADSGIEIMELFKQKFEEVNNLVIQPWIEECLEKLTV